MVESDYSLVGKDEMTPKNLSSYEVQSEGLKLSGLTPQVSNKQLSMRNREVESSMFPQAPLAPGLDRRGFSFVIYPSLSAPVVLSGG